MAVRKQGRVDIIETGYRSDEGSIHKGVELAARLMASILGKCGFPLSLERGGVGWEESKKEVKKEKKRIPRCVVGG